MKPTDIRIEAFQCSYEEYLYRTPIKFGGVAVDRVSILNVDCQVRTNAGKTAKGFGSMPMGNVWSFPSKTLTYDGTLAAMKALAERIERIYAGCKQAGHPIDLTWDMEHEFFRAADETTRTLKLPEPIPRLCTLVVASAFDAALHDAFGKVHGLNCYHTYGPDFLDHDLGHYLGKEFQGERIDQYISRQPKERMPLYHLVGALDAIEESDLKTRLNDGLPNTLPEWIVYNGLTHIKIKLNGDDLGWDVERVLRVDSAAARTQKQGGVQTWCYSLDFNEKCANVGYLLEFLRQVREKAPAGFERISYIEQPTHRDLARYRDNVMHEAAMLRPVVIDESLLDLESLQIAREMGYTGAALKACKGQSQSLLMAAAASKYGMFLCVQDLSCPGASLIHSAGLAAHVPGVTAIEGNSRQYIPAANEPWEKRVPGFFQVRDGTLHTGLLTGLGLGAL